MFACVSLRSCCRLRIENDDICDNLRDDSSDDDGADVQEYNDKKNDVDENV